MKKICIMLLLSMGNMLQGMELSQAVALTSDKKTTSQSASVSILSMADFWSHCAPYLLNNWGPQVATKAIKASSCADKATFNVFKTTRLKNFFINLFQQYALNKPFKKEDLLGPLFPVLFSNARKVKALYTKDTVTIEIFVEILKSCAQSKDWSPALARLEAIRKEPRLVLQLNNAYWDVNPLVRTTVLSHALLLNAPKELIKSLISCGAPVTNLSPKVLPPLLILAMKTTGAVAIDSSGILGEKIVSAIQNEAVDRTSVKELITFLCVSGAQIQDAFDNCTVPDPYLRNISALAWSIITYDNDLLDHLLSQQKVTLQKGSSLINPCVLAFRTFSFDWILLPRDDIQYLAGRECFKLLLQDAGANVSKFFGSCSNVIAELQTIILSRPDLAAELAENIITLFSLFIDYGVNINHLTEKRTILDRAQDEGWYKTIIDFLIEKGARRSSCEFTQEEIKVQTFRRALKGIALKYMAAQSIEQEKMRDLLKDALEIVKNGYMDFDHGTFHYIFALAVDLGASLEATLEFFTWSESYNLFSSDYPSYGNISSVFHKIVSWLHDVKCACRENTFNEVVKRESLRSLFVKLAQRGVKDKPNREGKTAAQKAYELGLEEVAYLISDAIVKAKKL